LALLNDAAVGVPQVAAEVVALFIKGRGQELGAVTSLVLV